MLPDFDLLEIYDAGLNLLCPKSGCVAVVDMDHDIAVGLDKLQGRRQPGDIRTN